MIRRVDSVSCSDRKLVAMVEKITDLFAVSKLTHTEIVPSVRHSLHPYLSRYSAGIHPPAAISDLREIRETDTWTKDDWQFWGRNKQFMLGLRNKMAVVECARDHRHWGIALCGLHQNASLPYAGNTTHSLLTRPFCPP